MPYIDESGMPQFDAADYKAMLISEVMLAKRSLEQLEARIDRIPDHADLNTLREFYLELKSMNFTVSQTTIWGIR